MPGVVLALLGVLGVLGVGAGAVAGCSGPAEDTAQLRVRLLVRDINLRTEGAECAGTGGYRFVHHRAPFRLVDGDGRTVTEGRLPAGTAVRTFEEDLGVDRVPTYCEFSVPVTVPRRDAYRLVVDDEPPIELTRNDDEGPALVAVVPS